MCGTKANLCHDVTTEIYLNVQNRGGILVIKDHLCCDAEPVTICPQVMTMLSRTQ